MASGPGDPRCYPAAIGIGEEMAVNTEITETRKKFMKLCGITFLSELKFSVSIAIGTESPARRDRPKCSHEKLSIAVMIQRLTNA